MTRGLLGALVIGILGTGVLLALGVWQLQRLEWKRGILAEIEASIGAPPLAVPPDPDPGTHRFLSVTAAGRVLPRALRVLTTDEGGPAFRIVSPFETGGRTLLLDRGVIPAGAPLPPPPAGERIVEGNLHWPEADSFTPPPDPAEGLWYARDVRSMAEELGTEPVMIVVRELGGDAVSPRPIDTRGIPNDHLAYAITWFSLAAVWAGMTVALVWRIRRRIG